MAIEDALIRYRADIKDIESKVRQIQIINQTAAKSLSSEFTKSISTVSSQLSKVQFDKKFQIRVDDGKLKTVTGTVQTFDSVIKNSSGNLVKLQETFGIVDGKSQKLSQSFSTIAQAQSKLAGQTSSLSTNFGKLADVNKKFAQQLQGFGRVTSTVGTALNQVTDSGSKVSKVIETSNGKFLQLTETVKRTPDGIQKVSRSVKELSKTQVSNVRILERAGNVTRTFGDEFRTLAKRAALTIPVWFALRNSIFGVFRTIRDGLGDIVAFDRSLQKLRRNITATSSNVESDFRNIKKQIVDFSLESGVAVEEITNAIQKFATVGFGVETALSGGIDATKLAVTLFGEAEETADAFSRALRILVDTSAPVSQQQEDIAGALSLTSKLWKTNQFDINEVNQALEKFAPVAKTTNLSIDETLKLLATLGTAAVGGARGGTLLRTSLQKLLENLDQVASTLGVKVNPAVDTTFSTLLKVTQASSDLGDSFEAVVERSSVLSEVFGGVRGSLPIQALTALNDVLKENANLSADSGELNEGYEEQTRTVNRLAERFQNLNKELGKAFVTGIVGGDDFKDSLQTIVNVQKDLINDLQILGTTLRGVAGGFRDLGVIARISLGFASFGVTELVAQIPGLATELDKSRKALEDFRASSVPFIQQVKEALTGDLNVSELERIIDGIETRINNLNIDPRTDRRTLELSLEKLREMLEVEKEISKEKEAQNNLENGRQASLKKSRDIAELVLKNELEIAKARGATASELITIEQEGRKQLNIQKDILNQLDQQIQKERAISEEQRLRSDVGNESLKLFRIAKTEGSQVARVIGEVLAGQRDFNTFVRKGGKELDVFKRDFGDIFESQQAERFFQGSTVPGIRGLRGGSSIPTEERFQAQSRASRTVGLSLAQSRAESEFARLKKLSKSTDENTKTNTESINKNTLALESLNATIGDITLLEANRSLQNVAVTTQGGITQTSKRSFPDKQVIDLNLNIDGQEFNFSGTPEALGVIANQAGEVTKQQVTKLINDIKNNPQSPAARAVRSRLLEE